MYARIVCVSGPHMSVSIVGSEGTSLSIRTDPGQAMVMMHPPQNPDGTPAPPKALALLTALTLVSITLSDEMPKASANV